VRIAVISDVHSNLEALDVVLTRAHELDASEVLVLGDIVGYGADPDAVVARLANEEASFLIAGNHDLAATGRFDTAWFNSVATQAIEWTSSVISKESRTLLEGLEPRGSVGDALLVHGSVVDPVAEYVTNPRTARASFDAEMFSLCFFGHTHLPTAFFFDEAGRIEGRVLRDGEAVSLNGGKRSMVNPGSVGQPRDGDPRASFLIYDEEGATTTIHRVVYPVERAQAKIRAAGLPDVLADRLAVGH
jgi:predicted phosphodiesterase